MADMFFILTIALIYGAFYGQKNNHLENLVEKKPVD